MNNPLIVITLAYILGVILGKLMNVSVYVIFPLLLIVVFVVFIRRNFFIYFLLISFFLAGMLNMRIRDLPLPGSDISNFAKYKDSTFLGQIDDEPRFKDDSAIFTLKVKEVNGRKATGLLSVISRRASLEYGDKVEIKGKLEEIEDLSNPGLLSYADYLNDQGITCRVRAARAPPRIVGRGGSYLKLLSIRLKNRLITVPQKTLPEPYATLLSSIVFGTKAAQAPKEIKETYKKAGVAHLLVASGMHLGILVGVCLFLVRSLRLPLWPGILLTSTVNVFYSMMTGAGPSILRAAIMAQIMLLGLCFEKEKEVYTSMAASAFLILLFNPRYLFEVGFQLSFAATWALVYVAPVIELKIRGPVPKYLSSLLAVAVAPVLSTFPITLFHFSQASVIGIVTNILLLPWIGAVVVLGFVSSALGLIWFPLGELVNGANLILLMIAHHIVSGLASLPMALIFFAPPGIPLIIGYYLALIGAVEALKSGRFPKIDRFRILSFSLAVLCVLLWNSALSGASAGLAVTVLDVGQGDSILIECPSGRKILVDGGEEKMGENIVIPFLRRKGIDRIDLVVLTHSHEDHLGGLRPVISQIKVDTVLDTGSVYESKSYQRFKELIRENRIKYRIARAGQTVNFDKEVKARILHPFPPLYENANNNSIVFRLEYKKFRMLFTGDNEKEGEEQILAGFSPALLNSDVLKVGHHGSRTSTSDNFIEAVDPEHAIISCGRRNKFRHPHKNTIKKLDSKGVRVYRTDQHGAVVIKTDGNKADLKYLK